MGNVSSSPLPSPAAWSSSPLDVCPRVSLGGLWLKTLATTWTSWPSARRLSSSSSRISRRHTPSTTTLAARSPSSAPSLLVRLWWAETWRMRMRTAAVPPAPRLRFLHPLPPPSTTRPGRSPWRGGLRRRSGLRRRASPSCGVFWMRTSLVGAWTGRPPGLYRCRRQWRPLHLLLLPQ